MNREELIALEDKALSYLLDNMTRHEAFYILTTDEDMIGVLIQDKEDGSRRIKILCAEYTRQDDDIMLWFDTDFIIDSCMLSVSSEGTVMYFRKEDIDKVIGRKDMDKVMSYPYIKTQLNAISPIDKRRAVFDLTGKRIDRGDTEKTDFMFVYFMARKIAKKWK